MVSKMEAAQAAVDSNERLLEVLDEKIKVMKSLLSVDQDGHSIGKHPFFYGCVGVDGSPGLRLAPDSGTVVSRGASFTGTIALQEDAPFIWTHTLAALRSGYANDTNGLNTFRSLFGTDVGVVRLGITECGSGHQLYQGEILSPGATPLGGQFPDPEGRNISGQLVLGSMINTPGLFEARSLFGGSPDNLPFGHGPNFMCPLPAEVILPASGVVEVTAKQGLNWRPSENVNYPTPRLYITLLGYKIYGD